MAGSKRARRAVAVLAALCAAGALGLWLRMGGVEVAYDAAGAAAASEAEAGAAEFDIVTYNVQARPWFDDAAHKFEYMSPLLNGHDIWAFQECFKQHERLWAASNHPVKVYHSRLKHPLKIVGSGLSILGRYPLVAAAAKNYDALGEFQNWPASKGLLMARFDVRGMPLDVYTTHIEAGKSPEALEAKVGQGEEIVAFVREHSPPEHSVILLGDFNMRPSRGPEDKERNKDNPRVWVFDKTRDALGLRDASDEVMGPTLEDIDRVLFRAGAGVAMTPLSWKKDDPAYYDPAGKPLSDHEPVFVRFRMQRG